MAQFMYLVSKSQPQLGARLINGVVCVLVNASTTTLAKLDAALACNAAFKTFPNAADDDAEFFDSGSVLFPANYFDTVVAVSASGGVPGSGDGDTDGDAYVIPEPAAAPIYVDHSAYTPAS